MPKCSKLVKCEDCSRMVCKGAKTACHISREGIPESISSYNTYCIQHLKINTSLSKIGRLFVVITLGIRSSVFGACLMPAFGSQRRSGWPRSRKLRGHRRCGRFFAPVEPGLELDDVPLLVQFRTHLSLGTQKLIRLLERG